MITFLFTPFYLFGYGVARLYEFARGKNYCLQIDCTPEQRTAIQFTLKNVLGLSYVEFQRLENKVPGPVFRGSREALEWLADGLRQEKIPCRVRRAFPRTFAKLETFRYPLAQNMTVADAYLDSHITYEDRKAALEDLKRNPPAC